ncbi:hypothetical protein KUM39_21640 [Streptomyces sp. J2-1]|uniref:hypothetical protein n=1 Tax=Streptomyces corallincola TaxID=2851888 RepID=UPI001C37F84A|nr:hypothetical protein [Streptomyces corallincola]MBV2356944.1 hypothetical protein [Streptomyces corallincola]
MPEHASTLQLVGAAVLTAAGLAWAVVVVRLLRRSRADATAEARAAAVLAAFPHQPQSGPAHEVVELTPAEQDAFAGLIRRLNHR